MRGTYTPGATRSSAWERRHRTALLRRVSVHPALGTRTCGAPRPRRRSRTRCRPRSRTGCSLPGCGRSVGRTRCLGEDERVVGALGHEHAVGVEVLDELPAQRADDGRFDAEARELGVPGGELEGEKGIGGEWWEHAWGIHKGRHYRPGLRVGEDATQAQGLEQEIINEFTDRRRGIYISIQPQQDRRQILSTGQASTQDCPPPHDSL